MCSKKQNQSGKWYVTHILLIYMFLFLLAGCSLSTQQQEGPPENDHDESMAEDDLAVDEHSNENKEEKSAEDIAGQKEEQEQFDKGADETKQPEYEVTSDWYVKPINDANKQVVLLTIDDAPDEHALEMAETLHNLNVNAIFFVNGHFFESEKGKNMLKQIYNLGFSLGNHTMTHADLSTLSEEEQREEIIGVNDKIEEITGERPDFFRAPFGKNTDYSEQLVQDEEMIAMNWSYGYDWESEYQNAEALTDIMTGTPLLSDGSILLMHDRDWTNKALEDIVTGLQDQGYNMLDPSLIQVPY